MSQQATTPSVTTRREAADAHGDRTARAPGRALKPPQVRTHRERRAEARRRILQAAYEMSAQGGFDSLTLAGIGEAAGYSRALPAHYFGSLDELVAALAEDVLKVHLKNLKQLRAGSGGLDALLASITRIINQARVEPDRVRGFHAFLAAALTKPQLAPTIRRLNEGSLEWIVDAVSEGQDRGEIDAALDPKLEASLILGGMRGVIAQYFSDPDNFPLDAARDRFVAQLRAALCAG
ncbi:MAG: TetR/AcrR family transcriptional regulator [Maricaulaceae bacterium]